MIGAILTEADLAARWGLRQRTLAAWRAKGLGPAFVDIGVHTIRYREEDVLAYEAGRTTGGAIPPHVRESLRRAAGAFSLLAEQRNDPTVRATLHKLRDELRALLEPMGVA